MEGKTELGNLILSVNDKTKQVKSIDYLKSGKYPIIDQSENFIAGYCDDEERIVRDNLPITIFGDHTRHVKFVNFPFACGADGTQLLKPKSNVDDKYFYYLVSRASDLIGNFGYDRHFKHLKEFKIFHTNVNSEQTRIAEILSTVDEAIAATEALIAKYSRIKTGLMQDLLTRGIDESGNIRSKATHRFVVKNGIEVPDEWEVKELKMFTSYISYGFTNPMPETSDGPYLLTAQSINHGRILYESCRKTSEKAFKDLLTNKSKPQVGDVLITKDGTLGRLALVDRSNICINQSVAVLRPKIDAIIPTYLKFLLESQFYQDRILAEAGGSTIKHIYITKLDKMPIGVPTNLNEQKRILQALNTFIELFNRTRLELGKLYSTKAGLMQDLLTGKVRVPNYNEILETT